MIQLIALPSYFDDFHNYTFLTILYQKRNRKAMKMVKASEMIDITSEAFLCTYVFILEIIYA